MGEVDVARPEADRRDPGLDGQGRPVMPVVEACERARPPHGPRRGERRRHDRLVTGDLCGRHGARGPHDPRRMLAQPRIGGRGARDPLLELPLDAAPAAALVRLVGQELDVTLESARGGIRHDPLSAVDDRGDAVGGGEERVTRLLRPVLAQPPDRLEHDRHLLDRVDGSALVGIARRDAGMAGAALDRDRRQQASATGDPHVQAARLRDDRAVGLQGAGRDEASGSGRLLVRDGVDDEIAAQVDTERGEHLGRQRHAGDAALHVACSAAVDAPVLDDRGERVVRPALARLDRDDVDVAVQEERPAAAGAREARDELRATREREPLRDHRMRRERRDVRFPGLHGRAGLLEPRGEVALQCRLVARARAGLAHGRVEPDQRAQQLDELVLAPGDLVAHRLLGVRQRHGTRS